MKDRSKTVVLVACAVQAFVVAVTIAWVGFSGSGTSDSAAAQTEDASPTVAQTCAADHDYADDSDDPAAGHDYGDVSDDPAGDNADECASDHDQAAGGTTGGDAPDLGGISLY